LGAKAVFQPVIVRSEIAKKVIDQIREKGTAEIKEPDIQAVQKLCEYKVKIHPYPPKEKEKTQ
jgi:coenzyme F420 hydrogenase subunit beta